MSNYPILSLVWRRKLLFLIVSFLVFSGFGATVLLWPKSYIASAKLLLETRYLEAAGSVGGAASAQSSNYVATQVEIIQSSRVAVKVIELLQMKSNRFSVERFQRDRHENETFDQFYTAHLKRGLTVMATEDANLIEISYRASDPAFAAQAANTFAKAYTDVILELRGILAKRESRLPDSQASATSTILLDEAVPPPIPSSPRTFIGLLLATLLAPLSGLIAVMLNEALDRRVRNRHDLEETTGVNVLCIVGMGRPSRTLGVLRTMFSFLLPVRSAGQD